MLTKTITPILRKKPVLKGDNTIYVETIVGTLVEYRLFGILLYKKRLFTPAYYGMTNWDDYQFRI
ncbi:MAG: hypothetical protein NC410_10380 [Oscillibacter sp.]|nr:hypothetical protein [Oscillibacter sp.]